MSVFLVAFWTVAIAEMGDRTQLLSLLLSAQFRKPWPIIGGIFVATVANHALAGLVGVLFGHFLTPRLLNGIVGFSMVAMAAWSLVPDKLEVEDKPAGRGAFLTTLVTFFVAEIGDKTQIATIALAAGYGSLTQVVAGTTTGMLAANIPAVILGHSFAARLPLKAARIAAALLFAVIGTYFLVRALLGH